MTRSTRAAILCFTATAWAVWAPARAGDAPLKIPLTVGLTTVRSVAESQGDYEVICTTSIVTKDAYQITTRAEIAAPDGPGTREITISRTVPIADQSSARTMRNWFYEGDQEVFPGTTPGVSAAIINELRTAGKSTVTLLQVRSVFGMPMERPLTGTVSRVEAGAIAYPMIVNGRRVQLPALHAKGRLGDSRGTEDLEFYVLDDPDNPLMLRTAGPDLASQVTRIEFPGPAAGATYIEATLAAHQPVDVYGIYFTFGSATLRPESERVLSEVAELLRRHPDWTLQIDGHTDSIGASTSNLDLSRHRSAAVKTALVQRYAIAGTRLATNGFGSGRPKDTNATVEGRALNRRVELRRT